MKYPKILSLTLANGFGFLIFGSIMAGCQKAVIHQKGFFTSLAKQSSGRMPASSGYENRQDPKQIFIYCKVNDVSPKSCFERHLSESLANFAKQNNLSAGQLEALKEKHSYSSVELQVSEALKTVSAAISANMGKTVTNRVQFCEEHASRMKKCLKQYLKKETFQILNAYQESNRSMNGHEYLFLKNHIQANLESKLDSSLGAILKNEKKKDLERFERGLSALLADMAKNRKWLKKSQTYVQAKDLCASLAVKRVSPPFYGHQEKARALIVEKLCLPLLENPAVKKDLDDLTYAAFERKLLEFQSALIKRKDIWLQRCKANDSDLELDACLGSNWDELAEKLFDEWASQKGNTHFRSQKSAFLMRAKNNRSRIKRALASGN